MAKNLVLDDHASCSTCGNNDVVCKNALADEKMAWTTMTGNFLQSSTKKNFPLYCDNGLAHYRWESLWFSIHQLIAKQNEHYWLTSKGNMYQPQSEGWDPAGIRLDHQNLQKRWAYGMITKNYWQWKRSIKCSVNSPGIRSSCTQPKYYHWGTLRERTKKEHISMNTAKRNKIR